VQNPFGHTLLVHFESTSHEAKGHFWEGYQLVNQRCGCRRSRSNAAAVVQTALRRAVTSLGSSAAAARSLSRAVVGEKRLLVLLRVTQHLPGG